MRTLLVLVLLLLPGCPRAQDDWTGEDADSEFFQFADPTLNFVFQQPECPEGFGPMTIELPEGYIDLVKFQYVEITCGKLIEPKK